MGRQIFVGSSTEGLDRARAVCGILRDPETECVLWTSVFEPGFVTLEALEKMLLECCAAVFVVTPDDETMIRNKSVKTPRANVMLEFGLVAGRLGRHNIALCQYPQAELPSDLTGLTVIPMAGGGATSSQDAEEKLRAWRSRLLATARNVARTYVVHGYTGRWRFDVTLTRWRGAAIDEGSYAVVNGLVDLLVASGGESGRGCAHGNLTFELQERTAERGHYQGEFQICHRIDGVACELDGGLRVDEFDLGAAQADSDRPGMARIDGIGRAAREIPVPMATEANGRFPDTPRDLRDGRGWPSTNGRKRNAHEGARG